MALGDILSCTIDEKGFIASIVFEGFGSGGTYAFDLALEDNAPGANTPYLTVVSEGFDDEGNLTTITRTVYLMALLRKAYPNQVDKDETVSGGNLTIRVALSHFVYADDRNGGAGTSGANPVLHAPAGWVTYSGNASHAISTLQCVNDSEIAYPVPIANWTLPGWSRLDSAEVSPRAIGFHVSGGGKEPLACVSFHADDGNGHTASLVVGSSSLTDGEGDAHPMIEYKGDVDLTGFTDNRVVSCSFKAYPKIGDTPFDSAAGSSTAALNLHTSPISYLLDAAGTRGYPICVVNPSTGTSGGVVVGSDSSGNQTTAAATPFATIAQAMAALSAYLNTNHGRSDLAGATVYLAGGNHNLVGGTNAASVPATTGDCWFTITPLPGVTTAVLVPHTNKTVPARYIRFKGCTFSRSSDAAFFDAGSKTVLLEDCVMADTRSSISATGIIDNSDVVWIVRGTYSRVPLPTALYRGVNIPEGGLMGRRKMVVGSKWVRFGNPSNIFLPSTGQANSSQGGIFFQSSWWKAHKSVVLYPGTGTGDYPQGCAVVQCLFENDGIYGGERLVRFAADSNENNTVHCIVHGVTLVGELMNMGYNDVGGFSGNPHWHLGWTVSMNATRSFGNKGDTFADDPDAIGNWALAWGCECEGNRVMGGNFLRDFNGLYTRAGFGDPGDGTFMTLGFVADRSADGSEAGMGDYHPSSTSILKSVGGRQMVRWDLDGNERATPDAAGAFRYTLSSDPPQAPTLLRENATEWIISADFEGTGISTEAGTWTTDATGYDFDYTPALRGSQSLSVWGSTSGTLRGVYTPTIDFPDHGNVWTTYMQIKLVVAATGGTGRFLEIRRASDNAIQNIVRVNVSNQLSIANGSDAGSTGSFTLTVGTLYHLWLQRNADGTLWGWIASTATHPGGAAMLIGTASNTGKAGNIHIGGARSMRMAVDAIRAKAGTIGSNPVT